MRIEHASFDRPGSRRYVIADIGGNHGGTLELAKTSILTCAHAGADAVKFQLYRPCDVRTGDPSTEPSIPLEWIPELKKTAEHHDLDFLCTPFSDWAVDELTDYVDAWKVGSFEADGAPFIERLIQSPRFLIVSTGMAQGKAQRDRIMVQLLQRPWSYRACVCHCVSEYPTPFQHAQIRRLTTDNHPFIRGYSSHTSTDVDVLGAVALGAKVIEKHIRFHWSTGPDASSHALPLDRFVIMTGRIRDMEKCLEDNQFQVEAPDGRIVWRAGSVVQ